MRGCLPDYKVIRGDRDLQKWLTKRKFLDEVEYRLRSSREMMKIGDQYEGKIAIEISRLLDFFLIFLFKCLQALLLLLRFGGDNDDGVLSDHEG